MKQVINAVRTKNYYMLIALSFLVLEVVSFLLLYGLIPVDRSLWYSFSFFLSHFLLMIGWIGKESEVPAMLRLSAAGIGGYFCLLFFIIVTSLLLSGTTGLSDAVGLWLATPSMLSGIVCATVVCLPKHLYQRIVLGLCLSPLVTWFCSKVPALILN